MSEPKYLRKPTPTKVKAAAARKRAVKPIADTVKKAIRKPKRTPAEALADLSDEWRAAEAAHLAGAPAPPSATGALILQHLERSAEEPEPSSDFEPALLDDTVTDVSTEVAQTQDALVSLHRADIAKAREIIMRLIAELDFATDNKALFDTIAEILAKPDEKGVDKMADAYHKLISLPGRVEMAKKLGDSLKALVPLERQAMGLSDGYVDAATERARKENAATATVVATSFDAITSKFSQIMMRVQNGRTG